MRLVNDYDRAPEKFRGSLQRYIEQGIPPGGFLSAVICNDLKDACGRADHESRFMLFDLVSWLYNYAPSPCWGSPEKFKAYLTRFEQTAEAE